MGRQKDSRVERGAEVGQPEDVKGVRAIWMRMAGGGAVSNHLHL